MVSVGAWRTPSHHHALLGRCPLDERDPRYRTLSVVCTGGIRTASKEGESLFQPVDPSAETANKRVNKRVVPVDRSKRRGVTGDFPLVFHPKVLSSCRLELPLNSREWEKKLHRCLCASASLE